MKWALALLLLLGCGRQVNVPPTPLPDPVSPLAPVQEETIPDQKQRSVILAVFSAPWCQPCKTALPKVQRELNAVPAQIREKIEFRVYVETGSYPNQPPTQADADRYKAYLGLYLATALADPWPMQVFRRYHSSTAIPAGAVLDQNEGLLRRFTAPVDVTAIVDYAREQASK